MLEVVFGSVMTVALVIAEVGEEGERFNMFDLNLGG